MTWTEAARACGTDKAEHGYMPIYEALLQDRPIHRILEIGVDEGASLEMWQALFPRAVVIGVDWRTRPKGFTVVKGNCVDESVAAEVRTHGPFDLIVDDASHRPEWQSQTYELYHPMLTEHGLYVVEDVHLPVTALSFYPSKAYRRLGMAVVDRRGEALPYNKHGEWQ